MEVDTYFLLAVGHDGDRTLGVLVAFYLILNWLAENCFDVNIHLALLEGLADLLLEALQAPYFHILPVLDVLSQLDISQQFEPNINLIILLLLNLFLECIVLHVKLVGIEVIRRHKQHRISHKLFEEAIFDAEDIVVLLIGVNVGVGVVIHVFHMLAPA